MFDTTDRRPNRRHAGSGAVSARRSAFTAKLLIASVIVAGALLAPSTAGASLSVLRPSPSDATTFYGHGGYSTDGGYPGVVVRAEVPAGSTVEQAYLRNVCRGIAPFGFAWFNEPLEALKAVGLAE